MVRPSDLAWNEENAPAFRTAICHRSCHRPVYTAHPNSGGIRPDNVVEEKDGSHSDLPLRDLVSNKNEFAFGAATDNH